MFGDNKDIFDIKVYVETDLELRKERFLTRAYTERNQDLENAKIYVDLFPCNECAKLIIQSGIKKVVYLSDKYNGTEANTASKRLFDMCGVNCEQIKVKTKKITLDL